MFHGIFFILTLLFTVLFAVRARSSYKAAKAEASRDGDFLSGSWASTKAALKDDYFIAYLFPSVILALSLLHTVFELFS